MVFAARCEPGRAAPLSSDAGKKGGSESPSETVYLSLRNASEFQEVFRLGIRCRRGGILVLRAPGPAGPPRVGFVVGRKVGGAVQRNRAKRRLRQAARVAPLQDATDYVIVASAAVVGVPFDRLIRWLVEAIASEETEA